jgi:hypothetical protein
MLFDGSKNNFKNPKSIINAFLIIFYYSHASEVGIFFL